jgi:hypothetical protein
MIRAQNYGCNGHDFVEDLAILLKLSIGGTLILQLRWGRRDSLKVGRGREGPVRGGMTGRIAVL